MNIKISRMLSYVLLIVIAISAIFSNTQSALASSASFNYLPILEMYSFNTSMIRMEKNHNSPTILRFTRL